MKHIDRPCDFAKWARAKNWLLEEAIYILKGKEPPPRDWLVDWLDSLNESSDTKQKQAYEQLKQPFEQGIKNGTLVIAQDEDDGAVYMTPSAVLAWTKQTFHPVPPELIAEIEKANAPNPAPEKPLHESERRTLLNIIRALAELHRVEPIKTRATGDGWRKAAESLLADLASNGIDAPCNEKTLAGHLRNSFQ